MATHLIGVDLGTSGMKSVLMRSDGTLLRVAARTYPMHRPFTTWAENDPDDWFRALIEVVHELVGSSRVDPGEIKALCIVAQRDPAVLLDVDGQVLGPSISWTDRRDPEETEQLYASFGRQHLIHVSGVVPLPGLTLPNLVWTKRHQPDLWSRVRTVLPPKDYLAFRLTGDIGTDISTPSRSVMNDFRDEAWSDDICREAGIPLEIMPPVKYLPWQPRAQLSASAASLLGLRTGTILAVGGGDDQSAALGSGVIDTGDVSAGTGTASCWRLVTDQREEDEQGLADITAHVVPGRYLYEMAIAGTGTAFRWFRDVFGTSPAGLCSFDELVAAAAAVEPGTEGLLFYPYLDGSRLPYFNEDATGVFFGILPGHRRAHFVRAILEGVAFLYPPLVDILASYVSPIRSITLVDGEAKSELWNGIKADVMGRPVATTGVLEAAAVGAAILAGMACGEFASAKQGVSALVAPGRTYEPDPTRSREYAQIRARSEAVYFHLSEAFHAGGRSVPLAAVS
jgi:sugar (pentulose or hexulose) kinase